MQEGKLPIVDGKVCMPGMVQTMRQSNSGAILVRQGNSHELLTAEQIFAAGNAAVEAGKDSFALKASDILVSSTSAQTPIRLNTQDWDFESPIPGGEFGNFGRQLRAAFDQSNERFMVVQEDQERARVVTPSETIGAEVFRAFTQCVCEGPEPRVHTFTPSMLRKAGVCNYAHAVKVTCS